MTGPASVSFRPGLEMKVDSAGELGVVLADRGNALWLRQLELCPGASDWP